MNEHTYARARDEVKRLRAAYVKGVCHASSGLPVHKANALVDAAIEQAAFLYPMPKVTRPRIVSVGDTQYKVERGRMYRRLSGRKYQQLGCCAEWTPMRGIDAEKLSELYSLFFSPTEEVEAPE